MADRDTDPPPDPLVAMAVLEGRLRELDDEERELLQRLAETKRAVAGQRAASRPLLDRGNPWKWAALMYALGFLVSLLSQVAR